MSSTFPTFKHKKFTKFLGWNSLVDILVNIEILHLPTTFITAKL